MTEVATTIARPGHILLPGNSPIGAPASSFLLLDHTSEPHESRRDVTAAPSVIPQWRTASDGLPQEPPLVAKPEPSAPAARQVTLQRWQGRIVAVHQTEMVATTVDLTEQERPQEEVTIDLDLIDPDDRDLVRPGAVFYWFVYQEVRGGSRRLVSELRFRRLAQWTKADMLEIRRGAEEDTRFLGIDLDES